MVKADIQIDKETVAGNGGIWGLPKYHLPWPKFVAMQWIEASLAAIIASSMPLMVALLGWLFLGQRLSMVGVLDWSCL